MDQKNTSELIERLRKNTPDELKKRDRFVLWRLEDKGTGKKPTKIPYAASGGCAKTNAPNTWASFDAAIAALEANPDLYSGIGFVLGDGIMGIDMDHVIQENKEGNINIDACFLEIIEKLPAYVEVSPSGEGLHIFLKGVLPIDKEKTKFDQIEFYDGTSARYFTLTGEVLWDDRLAIHADDLSEPVAEIYYQVLNDHKTAKGESTTPSSKAVTSSSNVTTMNDTVLLEKARSAKNGEKFKILYDQGDYTSLNYQSASEGTAALLGMLAFWTNDKEQMGRLFLLSAMYPHEYEKWGRPQSGSTWGDLQIDNAFALCTKTYQKGSANGTNAEVVLINGAELMRRELPPIRWIVNDIIPDGLTLLVGAPKAGKSYMALDIGLSMASGKNVLGSSKTTQGGVIYLALEDRERRMQQRIDEIGFNADEIKNFYFATSFPQQDKGGIECLDELIASNPDTRLVIIDTLELFRAPAAANKNAYSEDYKVMKPIKELADKHGISILLVHHTKKAKENDWVSQSSGSQALVGAVDTVFMLNKKTREGKEGTLHCTGRDIESVKYDMLFEEFRWIIQGPATNVGISGTQKTVIDLLKQAGNQTCKTLSKLLGEGYNTTYKKLNRMVAAGLITRKGDIYSAG